MDDSVCPPCTKSCPLSIHIVVYMILFLFETSRLALNYWLSWFHLLNAQIEWSSTQITSFSFKKKPHSDGERKKKAVNNRILFVVLRQALLYPKLALNSDAAEDDIALLTLLLPFPECWDHMRATMSSLSNGGDWTQGFMQLGEPSTDWAQIWTKS